MLSQLLSKCIYPLYATYTALILKVISYGSVFSPLLTGEFLVVFSASPLPPYSSTVLISLIMSQLRLLGSLQEMLTDCHHTQTPSGLLGQGI